MNEEPPIPQEPPQIPQRKLWTTLLAPPLLTGGLNLIIAALREGLGDGGVTLSLCVPLVGLVAIFVGLVHFLACLRVRYRGNSVVLSGFGYFIGQVVICFAVWFGTCLAAFPPLRV
ncbi:hypothetical protein [Haloferula sp. BvORR071]|uniref:hypothetical protein n=1 Tax=Haloferula sp. BvORR071 TaxID=1396141 RepID=UPI000558B627|nr:hypothetical protein [Haloferula sp. BvORR071]